MPSELTNADRFILARLQATAALTALVGSRIYPDFAPADTAFPYVIFQFQASPPPLEAVGTERISVDLTYLVRGVTQSNTWAGQSEQIVAAIDSALAAKSGSAGAGYVYICRRTIPYRDLEEIAGRYIRHAGWYYRLLTQAIPQS